MAGREWWLSEDETLAAIRGMDPWWESGKVPPAFVPAFKRYSFQEILHLLEHAPPERAIMILGARRVGKTTLLYQLMEHLLDRGTDPRQICFLSLDHPAFQFDTLESLVERCKRLNEGSLPQFLFLDEVQYLRDWSKWLKQLVDRRLGVRWMVTGSASATLGARGPEEGVGRWIDVQVPTLSFAEYRAIRGMEAVPLDTLWERDAYGLPTVPLGHFPETLGKDLQEYLLRGGFPELAQIEDEDLAQRILAEDVVEKVLNRDMAALYGVRQLYALKQIFLAVAYRSSDIIDRTKLAQDFAVSPPTVNQYIQYLDQAFLLRLSSRYSPSHRRVVKSHPKIYVSDAGLMNAILRRGRAILQDPQALGPVMETMVFNHVHGWARQRGFFVYYWRERIGEHDREVDIVVQRQDKRLFVFEVKFRDAIRPDDWAGLKAFKGIYSEQLERAYLVTSPCTQRGPLHESRLFADPQMVAISVPEMLLALTVNGA